MYLGSDEFNNAIENTSGNAPKIRVTLEDGTTLDNIKSIKYYGGSNDSDDVSIGTTNMARIDVTAFTDRLLTNNEIFLEQGIELADGVVEYMPIGYFTVQKPSGDIDEVSFTAYDRMRKFEKPYSSSLAYPTTSILILNELCQICGIELATTLDNAIEVTENLKGYTCREVLGYIASMHSSFACIDRYGRLNLRWYSDTSIEKSLKKIWHFEKSQDNFEIAKVEIAKDSETNYVSGGGITTLHNSNPLATQEITDDIFAKLGGFSYSVGEIEMLDDARLDPWDKVSVEYYDGKTYTIPCMVLEHDFKAYSTMVKSVGKSESENEYRFTGPTIQYLNRMAADLLVANRVIATKVDAEYVNSVAITTENFDAKVAEIKELIVEEIDGKYANIDLANIDIANINVGKIGELFAKVGLIDRATIVEGHITGFLDAVEVNANKITAGTLVADRILLSGGDKGILYALNNLGELTSTNVDSLDGYVLTDRTINADKIIAESITANELDVNQIFGNEAVLNKLVSQQIFSDAVSTNTVVIGANNNAQSALNSINSLKIGGTNLLPDTNVNTLNAVAGDASRYWSDSSRTDITCEFFELTDAPVSGLKYGVRQSNTVTGNYGRNLTWRAAEKIEMKDGEEYTLSCYARITSGSKARLRFRFYSAGTQALYVEIDNTEWKQISQTIKVDKSIWKNDYCNIGCGGLTANYVATVELCGFKLEKGNKATDWTPAPEDIGLIEDIANETNNTLSSLTLTENNVTVIDGGKIYTGSIAADKIDVNDLFAQDITATGSITGATLVSLENNSSKVVIDKGEVAIYDFDTRGEGGFYEVGSIFASGGGMVSASGAWIFESLSTELGNDVDEMAARLNKITQRNFILIGDSYLDGQTPEGDIDSWGVYLQNLLPEYSFSIHAIRGSGFGNTTSGKNFLDALKKYTGDKSIITDIIVCGGFNDAATSITTNAVLNGINNFTTYVENNFANAKVHIGYVGATNKGELLEQIKEAIRIYRACGSKRCGYISNMEYILRNTQFFTSDGVHPNQIGQKNIAWNLASYLTTGNVSVIQEKEDCEVVKPSTVTTGIALYTGLNNSTASLYHPKTEQLTFTGLSAIKMNGAEGSRVTLGTLTNSSIIGNQTTSSVATSTANASVSMPINVKTSSGWHTGIGTLEIISLNVLLRLNILNGNKYLNEAVTGIIIPPFTATFDSLDV